MSVCLNIVVSNKQTIFHLVINTPQYWPPEKVIKVLESEKQFDFHPLFDTRHDANVFSLVENKRPSKLTKMNNKVQCTLTARILANMWKLDIREMS